MHFASASWFFSLLSVNLLFKDGDRTSLYYIAKALMKLQLMYGVIPNIKGKGICARVLLNPLRLMNPVCC